MKCYKMASTSKYTSPIPGYLLDDLCCRFIINIPPEDFYDPIRVCFQIEQAHWFYLDFYVNDEPNLKPVSIQEFATLIFNHVPDLYWLASRVDEVLYEWRAYKRTIPTYGAILLDPDLTHVLLVQGFNPNAKWGFPKGKVNEEEEPWKCAIREVLEETGFDISKMIHKTEYFQSIIHEQPVRLYIISNVPRDTKFQPRTRNEIKACQWFPLTDIPKGNKQKKAGNSHKFYNVVPFVKRILRWVAQRNANINTTATDVVATTATDVVATTATDVVATTATDVVATTATDVVATTATDVVATTATDVVATTATDVVATTATDVVATTATDVAISPNIQSRIRF